MHQQDHASHQLFLDACLNVTQWPTLYGRTTYLGTDDGFDLANQTDLANCFSQMNAYGLQFTIQTPTIGTHLTGLEAFNARSPNYALAQSLQAPLVALYMDEPLTNGTNRGLSYSTIVEESANWLALVRQDSRFANLQIFLIEAYPRNSAQTIINFIDNVNTGAAERGVTGLNGLQIDHFWDGGDGPWSGADMGALRAAAQARGIPFSIIFFGGFNSANNCDFGARLYQQWNSYVVNGIDYYGFRPDIYTIESWDHIPSATVPEVTGACTFMKDAKFWLDSVDLIPTVRPAFCPRNLQMSFRASNGQYLVAESGGGSSVNANRDGIGTWETFTVIDHDGACLEDGDQFAFQTHNGVNYLQAYNGGGYELNGWGSNPESWETFTLIRLSGSGPLMNGDAVALRAANGDHWVAEGGGGREVNANRPSIGGWETWIVVLH